MIGAAEHDGVSHASFARRRPMRIGKS